MTTIEVLFPLFTDDSRGFLYLNQLLNEINEKDVIVIEGYIEVKDEFEAFLKNDSNFETFERDYINKLRDINPEMEIGQRTSPSFKFILKTLKGKEFQQLNILESYKEKVRITKEGDNWGTIEQRNKLMYQRLGKIIDESTSNRVITFITQAHSRPIKRNINTSNIFDLNQYTQTKFKKIETIKQPFREQSFKIIYSK